MLQKLLASASSSAGSGNTQPSSGTRVPSAPTM